jgi:uncharacterized protein (DUF1778 family)
MPKKLNVKVEKIKLRTDPEIISLIEKAALLRHTSISASIP